MVKFITGTLMASAALIASPALAVDAFTVFNGVNGTGGFYFGTAAGPVMTDYDTSGTGASCLLPNGNSVCIYSSTSPDGPIPGIVKGGSYPTVAYTGTTLLTHPSNSLGAFSAFEAATAGTYNYSLTLKSVGTDTTNGVGYTFFNGATLSPRGVLANYTDSVTFTGTVALAAGQRFGAIVDANGSYGGDSTAVTFGVTAVPEPAAWALMIGGFGMVGFAARRRRTLVAA